MSVAPVKTGAQRLLALAKDLWIPTELVVKQRYDGE
jgi:hypothetical protein